MSRPDSDPIHANLDDISTVTEANLNFALTRFLNEVCKIDGTDFPPKTLYKIVICLQMFLETNGVFWKLIDDHNFRTVKYTLDNVMKARAQQGLGNNVHKACVLTYDQEDYLWTLGLLGDSNPEQLLNTVVYLLGIHCALCAGKEHRSLCSPGYDSQLQWVFANNKQYIKYTEDIGLKTNKGGLQHMKHKQKTVIIYPFKNRDRCPVCMYLKYVARLPHPR